MYACLELRPGPAAPVSRHGAHSARNGIHGRPGQRGHQTFRANLPIRPVEHGFHAACDGQLGGIVKAYRDWRISGDTEWIKQLYPLIKSSIDYCIRTWDPKEKGIIEEPHHNTYDIEFWGPEGRA